MKTRLFVFLIVFWTLLTIFSRVLTLQEDLGTDVREYDSSSSTETGNTGFLAGLFDTLEDIPVINTFVPLMEIMSFQYTDQVPAVLSIFLHATNIFTIYIIYSLIRGSG